MSLPGILEQEQTHEPTTHGVWIVTVYDNDYNTIDEVMQILLLATGCTIQEAEIETWEVHNLGKSVVHYGPQDECQTVAAIISKIGIKTTVTEE